MKNKDRKPGFYWVMIKSGTGTRWYVCEFNGVCWSFQGVAYNDDRFIDIDEREIKR